MHTNASFKNKNKKIKKSLKLETLQHIIKITQHMQKKHQDTLSTKFMGCIQLSLFVNVCSNVKSSQRIENSRSRHTIAPSRRYTIRRRSATM